MAKCQLESAKVKSATSLLNQFSPLIKGSSGRYGPHVTSPGGAPVVAASGNASKENTKAVLANHFDILLVPSSFGPVSSYNASALPAPGSGSIKAPQLGSDSSAQSGTEKKKGPAHWNQCDLAVQCTDRMCQINMGTFLVLLIAPTCADTDGMQCVVLTPKGLKEQRRTSFLEEGTKKFQAHMGRKTASKNWGHSDEAVKRFAAAMQEVRDHAPEEERWKLTKNHSHSEMAHAALVVYDIMSNLLPKFGQHLMCDGKSNKEVYSDISSTPVSAIVDSGANSVLSLCQQ